MDKKTAKISALGFLKSKKQPVTTLEIHQHLNEIVSERTIRRWLNEWISEELVRRSGNKRSSVYQYVVQDDLPQLEFLKQVPKHRRKDLIHQLRDLWTHSSTALEGNTFTLGETAYLLEEGLTISGKPIKEHQEILGHAKAIELVYELLSKNLAVDKAFICKLHLAVQSEQIMDIYKPMGDWKVEPNGTNAVDENDQPVYIEYAHPVEIEQLMNDFMAYLNQIDVSSINVQNAPLVYSKIHTGFVHIHPFWDGNGRIARLISNIPLLKAGLPPLVINQKERRKYIKSLANYQINTGKITAQTGVWPEGAENTLFNNFCQDCYQLTQDLVKNASSP